MCRDLLDGCDEGPIVIPATTNSNGGDKVSKKWKSYKRRRSGSSVNRSTFVRALLAMQSSFYCAATALLNAQTSNLNPAENYRIL